MSRGIRVTEEKVAEVKAMMAKYPSVELADIARMCGVSHETVKRVKNGHYDAAGGAGGGLAVEVAAQLEALAAAVAEIDARRSEEHRELMEAIRATNNILADIGTILVNIAECPSHKATKETEAHFRDQMRKNRL